jgi:hypothetical protein
VADIIQVLPDETIDGLVAKVTALARSGPGEPVLLWVPRGIAILHQMEDFQALKGVMRGQGVQIKILSPDARVVGLGKVFGVEAETTSHLPGTAPADATRPAAPVPAPAPPAAPVPPPSAGARRPSTTPLPAAAAPPAAPPAPPRRSTTSPLPSPAPAAPPEPEVPPGVSETDWLLGAEGNLDALLDDTEHTGRSPTPPPDVLLPGMAPPPNAPPVEPVVPPTALPPITGAETADTDWLTAGLDLEALAAESLNPDVLSAPPPGDAAGRPPAARPADPFAGGPVPPPDLPVPPSASPARPEAADPFAASFEQVPPFYMDAAPPPAPPPAPPADSFSLSDLLQATEEEGGGPPMSFADWLALQGSGSAARAGSPAPPPPVDLDNLPAWMRPEPPAAAPPSPSAAPVSAGRKGVLRCPHCGEELDKEEMLRMLAEVWGLDS